VEKYFKSGGETVIRKFETRFMEGKLQSVLTFICHLLRNTRLSSLAYVIVSVDNRVTYKTNEVLASQFVGTCHNGMARPQVAERETASDMEGSHEYIE
jgi:hypothetical protein